MTTRRLTGDNRDSRVSRKSRNSRGTSQPRQSGFSILYSLSIRAIILVLLCLTGWNDAWAISKTKLTVNIAGGGQVALTTTASAPSSYSSASVSQNQEHGFFDINVIDTYYIWVKPNDGFSIVSMSGDFSSDENKGSGQYYVVSFKGGTSEVSKTVTITFQANYYFSATAITNSADFGNATGTVDAVITSTNASESKTATFTATANAGYEFAGWGTAQNATTYESTSNPYQTTITNSVAGSTAEKKLYAIFRPVFNFSATAEKIYDHGAVTASVTEKILGEPSATSLSTVATFSATPNPECTFEGWYLDREHTQLLSTDATCTSTITNTAVGSTENLTLYAWFKSGQVLNWTSDYEKNIVVGTTVVAAAQVTASSGLPVTYSSNRKDVISVNDNGDITATALSNDDITITATQAGSDEYNPATVARDFHVVSKIETGFIVTGFNGTTPTIYVDDQPTIRVTNAGEGFMYTSSDETVVSASMEGDVITLVALKAGTSTVTLTQPETATHSAVTRTYDITVSKVPNTLEAALSSQNVQVDGNIQVTFANRNNGDVPVVAEISEQTLSSAVNNGTDVITYTDGVITARNAGTAKIRFSQAASDKYEAFLSPVYEITVTKLANSISVSLDGGSALSIKLKYGATASLTFTSANIETQCTVTRTGGEYTTLADNIITAGNVAGTDLYEITQAETYKYEAGYASFSVRVNNTDEEEMYIVNDPTETSGWTLNTLKSYSLEGHPGDVLTFEASRAGANSGFYAEYSTDGGNTWQEKWYFISTSSSWNSYSVTLPEGVTNIRFELYTGSTLNKYIRNVKVSRKTYLRASSDRTDLGAVYTGTTAQATFTVDYSTTNGGNIHVSSSNANFTVSEEELATSQNTDGKRTFTVTYAPNPAQLGEEAATVTVSDLFYTQSVTLTATAQKRDNTLEVIGEQNLKVDDIIENVCFNRNSDAPVTVSFSKEGVVSYDQETNTLKATGAGEVTLSFIQNENDYHLAASRSVKVTVTKHDQVISWDNELSGDNRTLMIGDRIATNTATSDCGLPVTYSSSNSNVLEVDPLTGGLTAKAVGSNIIITATQSGNYKYNEASITRSFTVISKIDATVITTLSSAETNELRIGEGSVTIGCSASLTEENFSVDREGIVATTFENNTLTITPVGAGEVTVTLERAEDGSYHAISETYRIKVLGAVAVLRPDEAPLLEYNDYAEITLDRIFRAGYSTLALPFGTTVHELVGEGYDAAADWLAQLSVVTYNAKDGYTLYFRKVADGQIQPNEPYILHLAATVESPVFRDVAPEDIVPGEHAATGGVDGTDVSYTHWTMKANYTPGMSMQGMYGITGDRLMLGGSASTLNAYTAYIVPPAASQARVRVAVQDESGNVTDILSVGETEGTAGTVIYSLNGMRSRSMQSGINVVMDANGTVRKIIR